MEVVNEERMATSLYFFVPPPKLNASLERLLSYLPWSFLNRLRCAASEIALALRQWRLLQMMSSHPG